MTAITPDQPGDAKQRRIQAQARSAKGTCGHVVERTLLMTTKDGRSLCPTCVEAVMADLFGKATR